MFRDVLMLADYWYFKQVLDSGFVECQTHRSQEHDLRICRDTRPPTPLIAAIRNIFSHAVRNCGLFRGFDISWAPATPTTSECSSSSIRRIAQRPSQSDSTRPALGYHGIYAHCMARFDNHRCGLVLSFSEKLACQRMLNCVSSLFGIAADGIISYHLALWACLPFCWHLPRGLLSRKLWKYGEIIRSGSLCRSRASMHPSLTSQK